ncbi:MAG: response regulator [Bacteroidota bacterium]
MPKPVEEPLKVEIENETTDTQVIIVDDDPGFSFMLKDYLLTIVELRAELYKSGNDFLKNYRSGDSRKIILDYEFADGPNGLEVLQMIKALNPMAVVIIVSGQDDLEKAIETLRKGATDYFLKTNKTVFANIVCSLLKLKEMEKNQWN